MPDRRVRRAGSRWRILVHEWLGTGSETGLHYGRAYHVSSSPRGQQRGEATARAMRERKPDARPQHDWTTYTVLENTEFDELVISSWIHLEQMDSGRWWMNVGGVTVNVTADRDGRPKVVSVYGPDDYAEAVPGCRYELSWSRGDGAGQEAEEGELGGTGSFLTEGAGSTAF